MRQRYPAYDNGIKPGALVRPFNYTTISAIYADKIKMANDVRYYYWNDSVIGLVLKKMNRKNSFLDWLYPDIHVLVEDKVVIISANKIAPV